MSARPGLLVDVDGTLVDTNYLHTVAWSRALADHGEWAFPGAAELLRRCHGAGLAVVLATSAPADEVDAARNALGAGDAIDAVTSAGDAERSKPAPDLFLAALAAGGVDPQRSLVLGDSVWDVEAATRAGLGAIGVETGGFSRHELSEAGAVAVYESARQLCKQWRTSPIALLVGP